MINVNLLDGSFAHIQASNLGGDRSGETPENIAWDRTLQSPGPIFITDMLIDQVKNYMQYPARIGWLLEPPSLSDTHYINAVKYMQYYDKILTFDTDLTSKYPDKFIYYPFGGSWIEKHNWDMYVKTESVSMIASQKTRAPGHQLRHAAIARFESYAPAMNVDVMGYGYNPIETKLDGLADYRYSIVIESCKKDAYFSEKLIDCLACGTVPIYWGYENIKYYFNNVGLLRFSTLAELDHILINVVSEFDYHMRIPAIVENMQKAEQYQVAEDWIYKHYTDMFSEYKDV